MEYVYAVATLLFIVALIFLLSRFIPTRVTVFEYERGLRYTRGRFRDTLGPGQHWVLPFSTTITKVDARQRLVSLPGQEVLSSDGVAIKVSLAAKYEMVEPETAINKVQDYQAALYMEIQLGLREIIGSAKIEEVLEERGEIGERLTESTAAKAAESGLRLLSVDIIPYLTPLASPPRPVLSRLGDVGGADGVAAGKVGDGARELQHPVESAGREVELVHGR